MPLPIVHPPTSSGHTVQGRLVLEYGVPAAGVTVRAYNIGFAGRDQQLGQATSDAQGHYALTYDPPAGAAPNLQLRVVDASGKEVVVSATKFAAQQAEQLSPVVPASVQVLGPEYDRLAADMQRSAGGIANLSNAVEDSTRQDLQFLRRTTGWDARLTALAATAAGLTQVTGLGQDVLYALLRTGLPSDAKKLAMMDPAVVTKALQAAAAARIVNVNADQIAGAAAAFSKFASAMRLTLAPIGASSTYRDLLAVSGLTPQQQSAFAEVFFSQSGASDGLWQKASALGLSDQALNGLRLQGKLAHLTFNNAPLTARLQKELGSLENLSQLAARDFHTGDAWTAYITAAADPANPKSLDALIPPAYPGATTADRLQAYAGDLARKVRISFPTQVVARMVSKGDLPLPASAAPNVTTFLQTAASLGFDLGSTPLNTFISRNSKALFAGIAAGDVAATTESVKTLHRLFAITPSNESLQAVLTLGITSARDVAPFTADAFAANFGSRFPSAQEAMLFYRKAQQVNAVVLNLYTSAKQLDNGVPIYALSADASQVEEARASLVEQFPTMQSLFGSLDFCECEECRSVLSPAAYLVDLLRFLDPPDVQWNAFLSSWQARHNGQSYTAKYLKPYDGLAQRRPDLPNLPLTCENTNTVLPYIDVVNEIFEYYVVNGALDASAAYDTGAADSADLIAEPQNILPKAYATLNAAVYPAGLPFDLWIETVRKFLDYFKAPLWTLLDAFRGGADLELFTDANHYAYYRAGILAEYLGISPAEYALLTNSDPLGSWFTLYGYADAASANAALKSAKTLATRLGVTYEELVELVDSGFINPRLNTLVALQKLGVQPDDVFAYEGQTGYTPMDSAQKTAFEAALDTLTAKYNPTHDTSGFDARTWLSATWAAGGLEQILLLADPDSGCNMDRTTLQFANGTAATPSVLLKLSLFVRLRKKLGWSIDEIDRALQVFLAPNVPADSDSSFGTKFSAAVRSALVYLAHLQELSVQLRPLPAGRTGLLTLWSALPTTGGAPLYAQLFLNTSSVNYDPVFDSPTGEYLTGSALITDHLLAIQGALGLASDEIGLILADASLDVATAPLTLANVSLMYRYAMLADALTLKVADFLALKAMSGLDPFTALAPQPMTTLADDAPWNQTLEFVEEAVKVQASGFSIEDLQYLLRHRFDPIGKYRDDSDALMQLVRSVGDSVHQIQSANAVPGDPLTFTDKTVTQKFALVFPADVVQTFMGMWTGTIVYTATAPGVTPANQIAPATLAAFPAVQVSYDAVTHVQKLSYTGVPLNAAKTAITTANASPVLATLLDLVQGQAAAFYQKYLQLGTIGQESIGFLPPADFDLLFAPVPDAAPDVAKQTQIAQKRAALAQRFLPYLQQQLIREAIVAAMVVELGGDPPLTRSLVTDATLLSDPTQASTPLVVAFAAPAAMGLTATYYAAADGTGVPLATALVSAADTADASAPMPAGANSAVFSGYVQVPADGPYRFYAELGKKNAQVTLQFDVESSPLLLGVAAADGSELSNVVNLKAGVPYHCTAWFLNLAGGQASLQVQGESVPQGPLTGLALYADSAVRRFGRAHALLKKALRLVQGFDLDEREVTYLLAHGSDFGNLSVSALPTQATDDSPATAAALFGQFMRLAAYAALRQGPAGGADGLIDVFAAAQQAFLSTADPNASSTAVLQDVYQAVATLTRRTPSAVAAVADLLGFATTTQTVGGQLIVKAPELAGERGVERLWTAMQLVQTIGISAATLAGVTGIIDTSKTQDARAGIADNLRDAVKAYYAAGPWRSIAQSIYDKLRQQKRDALCACLVDELGLESTNQLFEYFLVDPGMEPVVTTSRLRLALSSVQTFVQRCLLNLESSVDPSAIPADQWEWMKRYRVWEANREIFLWPENWMEPEWRLDKTDLFEALESTLLQGDVTNALAEDAFYAYLKGLEERARLDIVSMFIEEVPDDPASNRIHVLGRNHGKPRKYYYRTFAFGTWSGWEPVKVDIDGDHITLVVWQERVHLFWVTFALKSQAPPPPGPPSSSDPSMSAMRFDDLAATLTAVNAQSQVLLQLNWSECFQGKWSDRKSSDMNTVAPVNVPSTFSAQECYVHAAIEYGADGNEGAVKVILDNPIWQAFRLTGRNAEPTLRSEDWEWAQDYNYYFGGWDIDATKVTGSGPLEVDYAAKIESELGAITHVDYALKDILQQGNRFALLMPDTPVIPVPQQTDYYAVQAKALRTPFFYQDLDAHMTLFVEPSLAETSWTGWAIPIAPVNPGLAHPDWWSTLKIVAQVPSLGPVDQGDPWSIYTVQPPIDWLTDPGTAVSFGTSLVGQQGAISAPRQAIAGRASSSLTSAVLGTRLTTTGAAGAGVAARTMTNLTIGRLSQGSMR